jgi:hypothetical protein
VNVKDRDERFAEQPCQVAAVVPQGSREDGGWTASEWLSRSVGAFFSSFFLPILTCLDTDQP